MQRLFGTVEFGWRKVSRKISVLVAGEKRGREALGCEGSVGSEHECMERVRS